MTTRSRPWYLAASHGGIPQACPSAPWKARSQTVHIRSVSFCPLARRISPSMRSIAASIA
eukprot:2139865-Alexandrium_andersonii.AAC.1